MARGQVFRDAPVLGASPERSSAARFLRAARPGRAPVTVPAQRRDGRHTWAGFPVPVIGTVGSGGTPSSRDRAVPAQRGGRDRRHGGVLMVLWPAVSLIG